MSRRRMHHPACWLALLALIVYPLTSAAEGVPGGYAGFWHALCPLVAEGHGFVDSATWRSMVHQHAPAAPRNIDQWTQVEVISSDDVYRWGSRLQTSRYEAGRTSVWIEDPRLSLKEGERSELSISGTDPEGQLSLASVEKAMDALGFRKIGAIDPYGRDGEYIYVRVNDPNERLNVRFQKGPETIAHVSGFTLVGYRWNNRPASPKMDGACSS
jgi:hypothetical protein